MGGCSVVVLMLLMLPIMAMGTAMGFGILLYLLYSYLLESIFCAYLCRALWNRPRFTGWIPLWGQYLLGKAAGSRGLGAVLAAVHLMILALSVCIAAECVRVDGTVFLSVIVLAVALKAVIAHRLYRITDPQRYKVLSAISILTLGAMRPIILFALIKKVCMFSKNT